MASMEDGVKEARQRLFPWEMLKAFLLLGVALSVVGGMLMARHGHAAVSVAVAPALFRPWPWASPAASAAAAAEGLEHSMTDEELLWRASFAPGVRRYPFRRVPKRYFRGHEGRYSIYVHALPSYRANFTSESVFYRRQIPSKVAEWGKMTMCDAERRLLANALLDISNEWFVLVSESCIPIFDFNTTYQYFLNSSQSFVMSIDDPGPYGRGRYNWNMTPEVELDQELAIEIVKDTVYHPKFEEFCRPSCYADEHYIQTMLSIEVPHALANRSVTWVDWSRIAAHPARFGRRDITEEFLREVREGQTCLYNDQNTTMCFLFARKFAPSALEPLLELAPTVLGFG
uniref:Uncharacterized protein n=1 Tax=Setaria italica TaxID=4555 RepID=K4AI51_SETIT